MHTYHVYGVGNALVDMEYEVDTDTLATMRLDKGVMTLVDAEHQDHMTRHLADHHTKKGAGGSAANSIVALAQLGGKAFHSCRVAGDPLGQFYLEDLARAGVDSNPHDEDQAGQTGRCLVFVTPDADRTMATFLGITGELREDELVPHAIRGSHYVYIEGYLVTSDTARNTAIAARRIAEEAGVKTAFTLSDPNMVAYFRDGLMEMIGDGVDLLFANESEALGLADSDDIEVAMEVLKGIARTFAITRGPKGAVIWDGERLIEVSGEAVEALDTLGAGDMFAGAFLYGLTHGWGFERAGRLAVACSARIVTEYGPRLPAEVVREILQKHL